VLSKKRKRKEAKEDPNLVVNRRFQCLVAWWPMEGSNAWWPMEGSIV